MVHYKFILGGVATAVSVATAAVVANQHGVFSSNAPTQTISMEEEKTYLNTSSDNPENPPVQQPSLVLPPAPAIVLENKKEKITTFLSNNKEESGRTIKIEKGQDSIKTLGDGSIEDRDLEGLDNYLVLEKSHLDSLISNTKTSFTFKKEWSGGEGNWKILAKEQLDAWVKTTSGDRAALQIIGLDDFLSPKDLKKVFDDLKAKEELFKSGLEKYNTTNKKTILFEKYDSNWKHSKTEIESWLSGDGQNKFTIEIQKGEDKKPLDDTNEANLIGLLGYLKGKKGELFEYKNPIEEQVVKLTLEKKETGWNVVHSETTINNWIDNTFSKKVSLELWDDGSKKELSNLDADNLKNLFDYLKKEKDQLKSNLGDATETNKKTIILEKYKDLDGRCEEWMFIKKAIEELLTVEISIDKIERINIKRKGQKILIKDANDNELIGLFKHLREKSEKGNINGAGEKYSSVVARENGLVVLEKESNNAWKYIGWHENLQSISSRS